MVASCSTETAPHKSRISLITLQSLPETRARIWPTQRYKEQGIVMITLSKETSSKHVKQNEQLQGSQVKEN